MRSLFFFIGILDIPGTVRDITLAVHLNTTRQTDR